MEDSERRANRIALALLAAAMCASATWLMLAGRDLTFSGDEVFYYARFVADGATVAPGDGLEYFLAPHNSHLVVLGKLLYHGLFLTVGVDYAVFRAIDIAAVFTCVGLFFVLARRHVGPWAALIPSVLLLFFGYAGESLLWAFSLHTIVALAFGLAALLTLERDDRRGDVATCLLLILSIATVEVGLAFAVGIAVALLLRGDLRRRAWVFLVPLALFAIWWLWARQFGQTTIDIANVHLIPIDFANALAAVAGSIFGLNPTGEGVPTNVTTVTAWGTVIAALGVIGLIVRVRQGRVPDGLWVALAVVLTYWLMITLGGRPPDSSRYIFVGTVMVLLIAASALRGARISAAALIAAGCIAALAIPPNVAKLYDQRRPLILDAENTRTEYAMVELARNRVAPDYMAGSDPDVMAAGGAVFVPLGAREYFRASGEFGSLAYPLDRVRDARPEMRTIADATLIGAMRIRLEPAEAPSDAESCPSALRGTPRHTVFFNVPAGGALLGSRSERPIERRARSLREGKLGDRAGNARARQLGASDAASRRRARSLVGCGQRPRLRLRLKSPYRRRVRWRCGRPWPACRRSPATAPVRRRLG